MAKYESHKAWNAKTAKKGIFIFFQVPSHHELIKQKNAVNKMEGHSFSVWNCPVHSKISDIVLSIRKRITATFIHEYDNHYNLDKDTGLSLRISSTFVVLSVVPGSTCLILKALNFD